MLLSACAVGPSFEQPTAALPQEWNAEAVEATTPVKSKVVSDTVDVQWWAKFEDPLLVELIDRARTANLGVRAAALRVVQSRVQRAALSGNRVPSVTASGSYQRQRQSEFGTGTRLIDVIGAPGNRDAVIDALSEPYDVYQAGFDVSWELDLWGRVRRTLESADAAVGASTEDLHAAELSLLAEVARTYFELRGTQDQLRIAEEDVVATTDALQLIEFRADGGLVTQLDVVSQRARLAAVRARIPQLQQRHTQLLNALSLLLGEPPDSLNSKFAPIEPVPAPPIAVSVGVPSELARRRPDIRNAEARLHQMTAQIGVAIADLYPRITLGGGLLAQSLQASDLTEWGARQWAVGPSLHLPIFDGGRRRSVVELRELQQQEAAVNYQQTVLRAWHEVDTAINGYLSEQHRNEELRAAAAASREAYEIASVRYEHGLTSFLVALDAQRTQLQSEQALSASTTMISTQLVALYKALGGGWEDLR